MPDHDQKTRNRVCTPTGYITAWFKGGNLDFLSDCGSTSRTNKHWVLWELKWFWRLQRMADTQSLRPNTKYAPAHTHSRPSPQLLKDILRLFVLRKANIYPRPSISYVRPRFLSSVFKDVICFLLLASVIVSVALNRLFLFARFPPLACKTVMSSTESSTSPIQQLSPSNVPPLQKQEGGSREPLGRFYVSFVRERAREVGGQRGRERERARERASPAPNWKRLRHNFCSALQRAERQEKNFTPQLQKKKKKKSFSLADNNG